MSARRATMRSSPASPVAFPPEELHDTLGEIVSAHGLRQLRIAETEKYAHVTFFFNGGTETQYPGEDRVLIPSPREYPTYDLIPEMSAVKVKDELVERIRTGTYDMIVCNFANCDMVGHTGVMSAAIQAVECVDRCLGEVVAAAQEMAIRCSSPRTTATPTAWSSRTVRPTRRTQRISCRWCSSAAICRCARTAAFPISHPPCSNSCTSSPNPQ